MLHLNTINEDALYLLKSFQTKIYLNSFGLAGGTSLALRFGHRKSIDLDLFSTNEFTPSQIDELLQLDYRQHYTYTGNNKYMLFCRMHNVKVDFVTHPFELIQPYDVIDDIRFFSASDVAAMKLFAVCKRGTKKDFYDVYELLNHFSKQMLLQLFVQKYGEDKLIFLAKSIVYFEEAEETDEPEILNKEVTWKKVKKKLESTFNKFEW